jgi:two-component system, NtrC family, sensor histidine kinase HydH
MGSLVYIRLIGYTFGTLLQLFWMVVILGYRRQRNFERVFFFLCLALFFFYSGSLLALNSQIYYYQPPVAVSQFAILIISAGLCMLPALLLHLHMEYAETRGLLRVKRWKLGVLLLFYAACLHLAYHRIPSLLQDPQFNFLAPGSSLGEGFAIVLAVALAWCGGWERSFATAAPDKPQRYFHWMLLAFFAASFLAVDALHLGPFHMQVRTIETLATAFSLLPILPFGMLIYLVSRHNFLQIGRQKSLLYALLATFLALLYLSLVRRVGTWLEPLLPPEASASILLFVLVIFIEPLQRVLGRRLEETAHQEMDRVQRLTAEIQQEARQGNLRGLVRFVETRVKEVFELAAVNLALVDQSKAQFRPSTPEEQAASVALSDRVFLLRQGRQLMAVLRAEPHGAALSGETRAALEFLCEQLPGALDLCRLIEEKLQLERELAERERLALVGQMAASISHNLKNPLGSMKTILQVQLENPELPDSIRGETKMVLEEIGRLSTKLNQLLQFSRPAVRGGSAIGSCDARVAVEEVAGVLSHEAERRGVKMQTKASGGSAMVAASAEAVNDILSNLVVNALEATPRGGRVIVSAASRDGAYVLAVEDDGPGIPTALREKILQPFFTTKSQGTGLGLAIVARRVAEFGGKIDWESPLQDGRGTRFEVKLPMEEGKKQGSKEIRK